MDDEFHTLQEMFNTHENVYLGKKTEQYVPPTRSLSLRIDPDAYTRLEELADRWGYSKSGLGARLLEVALTEMGLRQEVISAKTAEAAE